MVETLPVPDLSEASILRTVAGIRPCRHGGLRIEAERLGADAGGKLLVHNYGHGGAGWSLSWGTGLMATEMALESGQRRAAVLGAGVIGLTTALQLQRRGVDVTIYAAALPPETTSNMALAGFTPTSGLVNFATRTPGTYPSRDSAAAANDVALTSSCLANTGTYSLTHLGDLVEDVRGDRQQADQRRPGAGAEHHLQRALEGEHLGIEARAGDDVGQQVLDVVQRAGLGQRGGEVEDLLLEQELLFVVQHYG